MPQIDFFSDNEDNRLLLSYVFSMGFRIVPNLKYDTPDLISFSDLNEYEKYKSETCIFFLVNDEEMTSPLECTQFEGGHFRGKYLIDQKCGGPTLELLCFPPSEKDGLVTISFGDLSYYPTHLNTITRKIQKISPSLKSKYKQLVAYIKKTGKRLNVPCIEGGIRQYWILPNAYRQLKSGARLGEPYDDVFASSGL